MYNEADHALTHDSYDHADQRYIADASHTVGHHGNGAAVSDFLGIAGCDTLGTVDDAHLQTSVPDVLDQVHQLSQCNIFEAC